MLRNSSYVIRNNISFPVILTNFLKNLNKIWNFQMVFLQVSLNYNDFLFHSLANSSDLDLFVLNRELA